MTDRLFTQDVADLAGIEYDSVRMNRHRGAMPEPDGRDGQRPWWHRETIARWLERRPKRGQHARYAGKGTS